MSLLVVNNMQLNHVNGLIARNRGLLQESFEQVPITVVCEDINGMRWIPNTIRLEGNVILISEELISGEAA